MHRRRERNARLKNTVIYTSRSGAQEYTIHSYHLSPLKCDKGNILHYILEISYSQYFLYKWKTNALLP